MGESVQVEVGHWYITRAGCLAFACGEPPGNKGTSEEVEYEPQAGPGFVIHVARNGRYLHSSDTYFDLFRKATDAEVWTASRRWGSEKRFAPKPIFEPNRWMWLKPSPGASIAGFVQYAGALKIEGTWEQRYYCLAPVIDGVRDWWCRQDLLQRDLFYGYLTPEQIEFGCLPRIQAGLDLMGLQKAFRLMARYQPAPEPQLEPAGDPAMLGLLAWARKRATAPTPKPFELGRKLESPEDPHQKYTAADLYSESCRQKNEEFDRFSERAARTVLSKNGYDVSALKRKAGK